MITMRAFEVKMAVRIPFKPLPSPMPNSLLERGTPLVYIVFQDR